MSGEDTYAPKSPDLSSFYSAGFTQPPNYDDDGRYKLEQPAYAPVPSYNDPQHIKQEFSPYPPPVDQHRYLPPSPRHSFSGPAYGLQPSSFPSQPYGQPFTDQSQFPGVAPYAQNLDHLAYQGGAIPPHPHQYPAVNTSPQKAAIAASASPIPAPPPPPPVMEPSPVRTKFPTARIKRIMQADEEVGKVAQQTPIAVGKALELFMVQLVSKSADIAKEKGSKRVTAPMLKQVVENDDQWDFLREIVGRVDHEKEGGRAKAKTESESEEESFEPKKKARGGRRKKTT